MMSRRKQERKFCQNYIDSDYSKMIFTDECVFKGGKQRSRKWCSDQESNKVSSMKPKWKVNVWSGILLNGKISFKKINENMTSELYLKILNEKNNEMKRVWGKEFLLMWDNAPSHISNKTTELIKNIII